MDFTWITNDVGDITAVNVTSPITGGGSSGAVTIGINAATTSVVGAVQLSDSTSTTSSVLASTPTATKSAYDLADAAIAKSTVTTAGDIIYRNATVPVRLGIGTANQVLAVNSGATAPEWKTLTSTVPIMNYVAPSADFTTASTSYVDVTGVTITTTPVSGTNKVLISASLQINSAASGGIAFKVLQGASSLGVREFNTGTGLNLFSAQWLVTNASGSTTFKLQMRSPGGVSHTLYGSATGYGYNMSVLEVY
jgi:hypothetical protein